jgi:CheY-like chemotaxis protein
MMQVLYAFFEPQARAKNLILSFYCSLPTDSCIIHSDKTRLRQILTNLLNNSLKFTPEGSISYGYSTHNNELLFFVRDTGIGIKPELHELIFQPFMQAELELSTHFGGTGLGLSISRKLVEWLGGKIWLESAPGSGTSFFFTIPFTKAEHHLRHADEEDQEFRFKGKDLELLVAEDDDTNYLFVETLLLKEKVRILRARNGIQAVEMIKKHAQIQMILMDIKMPVMNGYEATRQIKQIRPSLPVIALTAYAMNEDRVKVFEAGCDDYLAKPVKKAELLAMVEKYSLNQPTT